MDAQRKIALKTVLTAIFGVVGLVVVVFAMTGRFSDQPGSLRRAPGTPPKTTRDWLLVQVTERVPFFLSVPKTGDGLLVNGREELMVPVEKGTDGTLTARFDHFGSVLVLTPTEGVKYAGQRRRSGQSPIDVLAFGVYDPLPERRFPKRPDRVDAAGAAADFSHVWRVKVGDEVGKAVFRQSDTDVITGAITLPGRDLGYLSGRVYGRLLQASRFDGAVAQSLELVMSDDGRAFAGSLLSVGERALPVQGEQADRVSLPLALRSISPPAAAPVPGFAGPAVLGLFPLEGQSSLALARSLAELADAFGPRLRFQGVTSASPERTQAWLERGGIRYPMTPGVDLSGKAIVDLVGQLPAVLLLNEAGKVVSASRGSYGPAAGHAYRTWLEAVRGAAEGLASLSP